MKKRISTCLLFVAITLLIPLVLTRLFTKQTSAIDLPALNQIHIYQENSNQMPISLEEYVLGVLIANIPMNYEYETLKAQAVIARTFALKNILICNQARSSKTLSDTINPHSKGYTTKELGLNYASPDIYYKFIGTMNYENILALAKRAVSETTGEVLVFDEQLITPLFFSTSAGRTRNSSELWSQPIPYLVSVESKQDLESIEFLKVSIFTKESIVQLLQTAYQNNLLEVSEYDRQLNTTLPLDPATLYNSLNVVHRDSSGYVVTIGVGDVLISGDSFANALGLSSCNFYFEEYEDSIRFICNGTGHGFGFSQYGANSLVQSAGYDYKQLLSYYYTGVKVKPIKSLY